MCERVNDAVGVLLRLPDAEAEPDAVALCDDARDAVGERDSDDVGEVDEETEMLAVADAVPVLVRERDGVRLRVGVTAAVRDELAGDGEGGRMSRNELLQWRMLPPATPSATQTT